MRSMFADMICPGIMAILVLISTGISDTLSTEDTVKLPNIAVLTLKNSEGISPGDAALITDRLNIELFRTNRFRNPWNFCT